jgi:glutaminyl-peptide cyclotransferase
LRERRALATGELKNANPVSRLAGCSSILALGVRRLRETRGASDAQVRCPCPRDARGTEWRATATRVVKTWPHDREAFTPGPRRFGRAVLSKSTGLNGRSTLRRWRWSPGRILKQVTVAPTYFAEGLAVIGGNGVTS